MYEIFEKLLNERGITAYRVSKDTGIPTSSLTDWKKKRSKPKFKNMKILADYFNVPISYLLGEENEKVIDKPEKKEHQIQIPLYARLSCGTGGFVDEDIIEYISLPDTILKPNKEYFANYAKGDSMIGAGINDGDLLVFEKTNVLDNGSIGAFCVDNEEAVCKRFRKSEQGLIMLLPANEKYDPIIVDVENTCIRIVGKLALVISKR